MPRLLLSVVTPAYNESENLPVLYQRLRTALEKLDGDWEWIVIDDHSSDGTPTVLARLAEQDDRVRAIRFSRNFGSHIAISCGLNNVCGDCAVVMAADLQDPPETIPQLLVNWQDGAQVVWAVRERSQGEPGRPLRFRHLYWLLMRRMAGLLETPAEGVDFFLMDRHVIDAFNQFREQHISVIALITWMGFRQAQLTYKKQDRLHGQSGWTLRKKLKMVIDSITAFTFFPIRLISYLGFSVATLGFVYAGIVAANAVAGHPVQGWSSLMVVVLVLGGLQMLMLGVLGEYVWRGLDEARQRPRYIIESYVGRVGPSPSPRTWSDHVHDRAHEVSGLPEKDSPGARSKIR